MLSLPLFGLNRTVGVFVAIVAMTSCAVAAPRPEKESEHGPQGGDEINIPLAGRNHGGRQCLPRGEPGPVTGPFQPLRSQPGTAQAAARSL
ncbi:PQQ-dependent sugar dehydrogenase [Variovorax sp. PAMC28562]|nr:PQQ-dependent sugar dehydrogenase [Variovorax sp. PAMC28562]